jgi:hypothetical protein
MAYNGYDYTELLVELGFMPEGEDEEKFTAVEDFIRYMEDHYDYSEADYDEDGKLAILEMREFLTALAGQEHTCVSPLWKGLLAIEDDWTFVKYFVKLIRDMWD